MIFAKPQSLYWLLILLPLGAAWLSHILWKRRVSTQVGHQPLIDAMSAQFSSGRTHTRTLLFFAALTLSIIALAQPQWGMTEREIKRMGVDVVFALDLSNSMLAEDASPNRLQAAADEMRTVMSRLDGDRVGLVVFTSISFPQSPLTTDYAAISFFLSRLHPDQIPIGGTSVGAATRESVDLLLGKKINDPKADQNVMRRAKNQVIVLVTDGEDHESDPLATAEFAAKHGISLVTVGIGDPNGAQIPTYDKNGRKTGVMRDNNGEPVVTRLDEDTLKQMAQKAGGLYLHYTGKNSVANGIVNYLNELEKTELDSLLRQRYKDRYMFFLAPALLMLLIASSLGQRRKQKDTNKHKLKSTQKMLNKSSISSLFTLLALLLVAFSNTGCDDAFRSTIKEIDHANGLLSAGRFDDAVEAYQQAEPLVGDPNKYHYNLGRAYLSTGDFALAQSNLARALATDNENFKFDVLYNLGLALAGQDLWQQAYDTFKQALLLDIDDPQTYGSERYQNARRNLELAFQKLFPPCAELEDDLEPNNSISQASQLENLKTTDRTLCGQNDDWFAIPASPGSLVKVTAKFKALRETPDPEHVFLPQPDDLQLVLYDDRGTEAVSIDQGIPHETPTELAKINQTQRTQRILNPLLITPDMLQGGQNHLFLKVTAADGLEFKYDLDIEVIPPCSELDDTFEPNDSAYQTAPLAAGSHPLHICPGNEDWFRVDIQPGDSFFVDIQPADDLEKKTPPTLELEIVNPDTLQPIQTGRQDGAFLTAGLQNIPHSGHFLIRIKGADNDQQGPYNLDLYQYEPCPIGEDRYAPNHAPQQAAELNAEQPIHRYLRLCENNPDHFLAPVGDDKSLELGLGVVSTENSMIPGDASNPSIPSLELDLLSQDDATIIASAVQPEAIQPDDQDLAEHAMPIHHILVQPDIPEENALIRVNGEPGFYHLVTLNPPESDSPDDDDQDDQEQEDQKDDKDKSDDDDSDDDQSDDENADDEQSDDEDSDNEDSDGEKSDDEDSDGENSDSDDASNQDPEEQADPESAENAVQDESGEEVDAQHVQDILQALEEADDNFQMQKALENMPARLIEKNW